MIYLIIAIVFGSLFSVMLKLCHRWQIDSQQVIFFNYFFAYLITLAPLLFRMAGPAAVPVSRSAAGRAGRSSPARRTPRGNRR